LALSALAYAGQRYRLAIDHQEAVCFEQPRRWFVIDTFRGPGDIIQGDMVAFHAAATGVARLDGRLFIKRAAAVPGDWVTVSQTETSINGTVMAEGLDLVAQLGLNPMHLERHERVPVNHFWMLGETRQSFDSRYWGFVPFERVVGTAYALF
jgi:conjugal transfer pilin signal peptidase TrbI